MLEWRVEKPVKVEDMQMTLIRRVHQGVQILKEDGLRHGSG
jgi:hypothetical protein